jgi:four helix bundle protein
LHIIVNVLQLELMSSIKRFEDLEIWKLARELSQEVYVLTLLKEFSRDFSLVDQSRKSGGSIMDNIAEGFERGGNKEFTYFLSISKGSCGELKSQLYRALDRKYITEEQFSKAYEKADKLGRKIHNLMNYLSASTHKGIKFKPPEVP